MPASTTPSVFISYSHLDRAWRDLIASRLNALRLRVTDDTVLLLGEPWEERLAAMREEARVAILVVTQNFLASETIQQKELPHLLQLRDSKRLRLLPVVAETSNWRAVKVLSEIQVFPPGGKPLSSGSQDETKNNLDLLGEMVMQIVQDGAVSQTFPGKALLKAIAKVPAKAPGKAPTPRTVPAHQQQTPEKLDKESVSRLSEEVLGILGHADQLRAGRGQLLVHVPHILLSLAAWPHGQLADLLRESRTSLEELIGGTQDGPERLDGGSFFKKLPRMSANVSRALARARDKADEGGVESIVPAHLLYGVLTVNKSPVVAALNQLGITADRVVLLATTPAKASRKPLAGYQSDDPTGEDLLEVGKEVEGLASVLAAKDVDPPLSLGLFGDWGSGKSFFMRQLERRIDSLQQDARQAHGNSAFCQDIVQLTFNAWNYIDTDLWASLAAEIFEGLAAAIARKRGKDSQDERALVLAAASSSEAVLTEAERRKREAENELAQSEQRLAVLRQKESGIEAKLSPVEVFQQAYRFALRQRDVQQHLGDAAKELHLPEAKAATAELGGEILALRGIVSTTFFAIRKREHSWIWIAVLGAALATAFWLAPMLLHTLGVGDLAARVIGMLTLVSAFLTPVVRWAGKAKSFIDSARAAKEQFVEQQSKQRMAELETEHVKIQERVEQAREDVRAAARTLTDLDTQLEQMLANRQMADYIRQRNESSDYTRHLGVIARVRGDFMHLSTLLRDVHNESADNIGLKKGMRERLAERGDDAADMFPRIDRIILYIDDLDRCPEKNVVEVLQAVHLLLAFPLFVVVVGVDPRWLLHSLQKHSAAFQAQPDETREASSEEDLHWKSTPLNYLEKIFQIPFTLRPIDRTGFARLVDSFATERSSPTPSSIGGPVVSRSGGAMTSAPPAASALPAKEKVATPVAAPATEPQTARPRETGSRPPIESIDRHPAHLLIEEWERGLMKKLHELIPSPRAGKRFINIYRLLRATVSDQERARFVGDEEIGEYQCALLLLAILTGYPTEATEILRKLIEEEHLEPWREFIAAFKDATAGQFRLASADKRSTLKSQARRPRGTRAAAELAADPRQDAQAADLERALDLVAKLERLDGLFGVRPCTDFQRWAARVARYSFQSGRVLLHQRPA